ncbi:MAG: phytoene/squalene synthase family protein [Vicinamibacterales bacterium]
MNAPGAPAAPGPAGRGAAIRAGSQSFALASRLFDPATRDLVWDLYAWCRHCDDVVDGQTFGHDAGPVADRAGRLDRLRAGTEAAFDGTADPADPFGALGRVVAATGLPRRLADDHLAGFAMDAAGRRYAAVDDTLDYCYHVAGVVGLMMAWVMGVRDPSVLLRASDLGLAFQLSNIARDVGDDLRHGRVYVPATWLEEAGVALTPGLPLDRAHAARVAPAAARLVAEAERYYDSAWHGVPYLPFRSAWAVATARLVYRDIGRAVVHRGADAWATRTVVSTPRKLARLVEAGLSAGWGTARGGRPGPPRDGLFTPPAVAVLG